MEKGKIVADLPYELSYRIALAQLLPTTYFDAKIVVVEWLEAVCPEAGR
jgi:hypothetical protein